MIDEDGNLDIDENEIVNTGDNEEGWDVDDITIPPELEAVSKKQINNENNGFIVPQRGQPPTFFWPNNSSLVADHVAAGSFSTAIQLLNKQLGVVNFKHFKQLFTLFYSQYVFLFLKFVCFLFFLVLSYCMKRCL